MEKSPMALKIMETLLTWISYIIIIRRKINGKFNCLLNKSRKRNYNFFIYNYIVCMFIFLTIAFSISTMIKIINPNPNG